MTTMDAREWSKVVPGDFGFDFHEGAVQVPRAAIEISVECPPEYVGMIRHAVEQGWLQPVAYVRNSELTWESLKR